MMAMAARAKGPAQEQLDRLDHVFGSQYFERGRLVVTVARDLPGVMKVAHKLQAKVNGNLGGVVEVIMEHVKHEWWMKLHETTTTVGLHKGPEVMETQVTHIPEGVRIHPYKRDHMPTLELLLLWEDSGVTRGHCLYSLAYPQCPSLEQVDTVYEEIEPYFAKRWIVVELRLAPPVRGEFEELDRGDDDAGAEPARVGAGADVSIMACHAYGFARDQVEGPAAHVTQCQPMIFRGVSDSSGRAKICFLPADVNKVQVAETGLYYASETLVPRAKLGSLGDGPSQVVIELTPKALASTTVHVFELPRKLPSAEETDGIIDWAAESRDALANASVEVAAVEAGAPGALLTHKGGGAFVAEDGGLPEGCVSLLVTCPGYQEEERTVMLLVGENEFYVPLKKMMT